MKRFLAPVGLIISIVCIFFFVRAVAHHWSSISSIHWGSAVWLSMSLAAIIYIGTYGPISYAWNCSLTALGHRLPLLSVLRILLISQFAKYLPGNVGHHVGRVVLGRRAGLSIETTLGSMILDTLLVLSAGGLCSIWGLGLLIRIIRIQSEALTHAVEVASLSALIIILVAILLPISRRALIQQARHVRHLVQLKNMPLLGKALVAHTGSFLAGGTALYLLCVAFTHNAVTPPWAEVTGIYAAAWLLGFLIPGAPAGLGVREVALLLGLGPIFGTDVATEAAAMMRAVTTVGDGIAFMTGLALRNLNSSDAASAKHAT